MRIMKASSCVVCGGDLNGRRLTCSPECYRDYKDATAVGERNKLDGYIEAAKERKLRTELKRATTAAMGRRDLGFDSCDYCGGRFRKRASNHYFCCTSHRLLKYDGYKNPYHLRLDPMNSVSLYTIHTSLIQGEYVIQKFDADYLCESIYVMTSTECSCPQGHKPKCRHRTMFPLFLKFGHIGDGWFLEWDTRQWRRPVNDIPVDLPEGVTVMGFDDPHALHNAIANAVGEETVSRPSPGVAPPSPEAPPPSPPEGQQPVLSAEVAPTSPVVVGAPLVKRRKMS